MRFIIDAQLPPRLAALLCEAGHDAEHVTDIDLGAADDTAIWSYAKKNSAVIISKDQDFAERAKSAKKAAQVVWIRLGNTTTKALWFALEPMLLDIIEALQKGEKLIEIV